jgi:hypothetical protein
MAARKGKGRSATSDAREQYGYTIQIEVVLSGGNYADTHKRALAIADGFYDQIMEAGHVLVRETGEALLSGPEGVFCEGCEHEVFPGIRWPSTVHGDDSREWVERCDRCERYESDTEAAEQLRQMYPADAVTEEGRAIPAGRMSTSPFFSVGQTTGPDARGEE